VKSRYLYEHHKFHAIKTHIFICKAVFLQPVPYQCRSFPCEQIPKDAWKMGKRHAQQNRPSLLQTINFSASQRLYRQSIVDSNVGRRRKCVLCGRCQRTKGTIFASFALDFHAAFCARVPYAWEFHVYFILLCVCAKKRLLATAWTSRLTCSMKTKYTGGGPAVFAPKYIAMRQATTRRRRAIVSPVVLRAFQLWVVLISRSTSFSNSLSCTVGA